MHYPPVIIFTDKNGTALGVGKAADLLQIIIMPALLVLNILLFRHWIVYFSQT